MYLLYKYNINYIIIMYIPTFLKWDAICHSDFPYQHLKFFLFKNGYKIVDI